MASSAGDKISGEISGHLGNGDAQRSNADECISESNKGVAYVFSKEYIESCDTLPKVPQRASMTHSLIASYELLPHMTLVKAAPASMQDISLFHSEDYVTCLQKLSESDDKEKLQEEAEEYGLLYDCPTYDGVYDYARGVVGASVTAAQCLMLGKARTAINWPGGWHHAKRDTASGFCYLNDIVVAILKLREKYERVLYVDLDLHHGDGVEDAFCATNKVFTLSFHKYSPGFFPGSGNIREVGMGKGKHYAFNVPLMDGVTDEQYTQAFDRIFGRVLEVYRPDAIVCQCGADALAHDPMAAYNLTPAALAHCVVAMQGANKPLLLLGGGGYNIPNVAKCWTYITAQLLGREISDDIPEHEFFPEYGPDYSLSISPANMVNKNKEGFIERIYSLLEENLSQISSKDGGDSM